MVLDHGELLEYDTVENLLKNEQGAFYQLVQEAGLLKQVNGTKKKGDQIPIPPPPHVLSVVIVKCVCVRERGMNGS